MLKSFQPFRKLYLVFILLLVFAVKARETDIFLPHSALVSQVVWSPDGSQLATLSWTEIKVFDTNTWEQLSVISNSYVYDIDWHPNSQLIAGVQGGDSERLFIWDTKTGELVQVIGRNRTRDAPRIVAQPQTLAWHPDGNIIATDVTMSFDEEILLWDVNTGQTTVVDVAGETWHNSTHLAWSHNGEMLLSSGADDLPPNPNNYMTEPKAYILDLDSGAILFAIPETASTWSPNDDRIASRTIVEKSAQRITIWNMTTLEALIHFDEHTNTVISIAWNAHTPVIASADIDDNLFIWNVDTGIGYDVGNIDLTGLRDLAWKPDSNILAIAANEGVLIKSYDFD